MVLPALAKVAQVAGQGAAKMGGQAVRATSKGAQSAGRNTTSRLSNIRKASNSARQNKPEQQRPISPSSPPRQTPGGGAGGDSDAARQARLKSSMMQAQKNPLGQMPQKSGNNNQGQEEVEEREEEEQGPVSAFKAMMQKIRIEGALVESLMQGKQAPATYTPEEEAVQNAAKKMAPKAVGFLTSIISDAIGVGTGGVGYIVTIFPKMTVLLVWNLQLFYGGLLKKGKDKFIPPLTWAPIKVPIDPKARMFMAAVIMMDLMVMILMVVIGAFLAIIIYMFSHPCVAADYFGKDWGLVSFVCKVIT